MQNDRFDAIPIPEELDNVVKAGIREGIREERRLHKNRFMLRFGAIAAAALVIVCAGVLFVSDPAYAARLPLIGRIFSMVQEKVSYKGDFSDGAKVYVEEAGKDAREGTGNTSRGNTTQASEENGAKNSEGKSSGQYIQTSNGLTVTVSEANCTEQALYLALCIENEEDFPADFIKTKNMDGYVLDYDILHLTTESYYDVPGMGKKERGAANGYSAPYYIEGNFVDARTFTGIIRVALEDDLMSSGRAVNRDTAENDADLIWTDRVEELPDQFTYYLEISDIYGELMEYEEMQARDPETGEMITVPDVVMKHYEGTWNFAIEVSKNRADTQTVQVNKTNEDGVGIASVEKTAFEISAKILLPEGAEEYDYVIAILDADGKRMDSQGENAEVFSTYGRNTDTVYVYVCDYMQFMDELKGDSQKIAEGALFGTEVHF